MKWPEWLGWINDNREWVFSGIGVFILATIGTALTFILRRRHSAKTDATFLSYSSKPLINSDPNESRTHNA